jgi:inhibitor of nuclear factor kappa-B kinase subunit alpha
MFSSIEEIWIVEEFARIPSPVLLKRKFVKKFQLPPRKASKLLPHHLLRVIERFRQTGSVATPKKTGRPRTCMTQENFDTVENYFLHHRNSSVQEAARVMNLKQTTTYKIIRNHLKWKPYKFHPAQELTENHMLQRRQFCNWFISENVDPQKIIFSDEKWFSLKPHPNRQNTRHWSITNPHNYEQCYKQGQEKLMCWVGIVDGRVLPIVWFQNADQLPVSVNGENYLDLLQTTLWPSVRHQSTRQQYWFMQDGAPCHCTNNALRYLNDKFDNRVISRRSANPWPAHSPDLNPLDYWFWGYVESQVYIRRPRNIESLKRVVEEVAYELDAHSIKNAVGNFTRRLEMCFERNGAHFEAEL